MTGVGPGFVGCFEHFTSRTVERSNFCRLFRAFHVADSRESAILSAVPSIPRCRQPRDQSSVGYFEHFSSQTAESPVFCRLFRAFHGTNSREISLLSAFRYSRYPQQPTSISITVFWHSKEEPPQKSRRLFFIVDNLVLDKFGLSAFL